MIFLPDKTIDDHTGFTESAWMIGNPEDVETDGPGGADVNNRIHRRDPLPRPELPTNIRIQTNESRVQGIRCNGFTIFLFEIVSLSLLYKSIA